MILDEACSGPVLATAGGSVVLLARTDAVLLEPKLLLLLTKAWRRLDTPQVAQIYYFQTHRKYNIVTLLFN